MKRKQKTREHERKIESTGGHFQSGNLTGKPARYPNGDVLCQHHNDRIDHAVCITRGMRQPEKCTGCPLNL